MTSPSYQDAVACALRSLTEATGTGVKLWNPVSRKDVGEEIRTVWAYAGEVEKWAFTVIERTELGCVLKRLKFSTKQLDTNGMSVSR